ncbi:MFS transporter [Geodermatophilus sabuli]|uniref:Predicted arabinose efflux permease, MFS family n=1 Tax=Geodermatophilus sabuli TaxID=1564158 RepID=A0A285E661_9ACTN|nr:MFS transporter [Geodermatophilus sabuli]MBB3082635.1 putative MFS family arabinose efflux permease [Geodermatophilus sabuli]SNX94497.1 Predicted arabinose efflux permease, MFS family [Geodermatophilus sabuli]
MRSTRPRRTSPIRLLQANAFVSILDRFAMPPLLITIAASLDVPLSAIVQAAGAYFLAYGLSQPLWGVVSDALGLVRTMRLALVVAGLAAVAAAFAWSPLALGIARGVGGAFFGAAYPAGLIYVGDTVPTDRRQRELTRLMVGVAFGTALASVGAGVVGQQLTWRAVFVITGLGALALSFALRYLDEPPRTRVHRHPLAPFLTVARSRTALFVLALAFVEGGVLIGVLTLLPSAIEAAGATAALAGAVTAVYGAAVLVFATAVGRLSRRLHPSRLIAIGAAAAVAACLVLSLSRAAPAAIAVTVLLGLAWAAMHSSLQTWATEVLPAARATIVSLFAGALFCGSALASVAVADLADAGRYRAIFLAACIIAVPLGVVAVWGRSRWRPPA